MRYDTPGLRGEDFVPIHPDEDKIEEALRAHPDWSDDQVAAEATRLLEVEGRLVKGCSVHAADVANFRRDNWLGQ